MTHNDDPLRALIEAEREDVAASEAAKASTRARLEASIAAGATPPLDLPPSATSGVLSGSKVVWWLGALVVVATVSVIGLTQEEPAPKPAIVEAPAAEAPAPRPTTGATIAVAAPDVPRTRPTLKRRPAKKKRSVEKAPVAKKTPGGLAEELVFMRRAQRLMAKDRPAEALDALAGHRRRFAKGVLREEREALTIVALCRLGRTGEAESKMAVFEASFPKSPQTERIRSECLSNLR